MKQSQVYFLAAQIAQGGTPSVTYMDALGIAPECLPAAKLAHDKAVLTYGTSLYLLRELTAAMEREMREEQSMRPRTDGVAQ